MPKLRGLINDEVFLRPGNYTEAIVVTVAPCLGLVPLQKFPADFRFSIGGALCIIKTSRALSKMTLHTILMNYFQHEELYLKSLMRDSSQGFQDQSSFLQSHKAILEVRNKDIISTIK